MKKVLLHICCGVCASSVVDKLKAEGFSVYGYFYNPNIHPAEEYFRRLDAARIMAGRQGIELFYGDYDMDAWFERIKGMEQEPEGGMRCRLCFQMRLEAALNESVKMGMDNFATTLSISPHKDSGVINEIGASLSPERFLAYDFKKDNGFSKSCELAKTYDLYKQKYCGCLYSKR